MPDRKITVGQLTHQHLGRTITVHGLHRAGTDFDTPPTDVTGTLRSFHWTRTFGPAQCSLRLNNGPIGGTLPATWTVTLHPRGDKT